MTISRFRGLGLTSLVLAAGCSEGLPTTNDGGLIPVAAETVEFTLPFEAFATEFRVDGGYGMPFDLPGTLVARGFGGELDSHALIRFGAFPRTITVTAPSGTPQLDSTYVPVSGTVVLYFDTASVRGDLPMGLEFGATETPWHGRTASWTHAVDTLGGRTEWPEAGGGPVRHLWSGEWSGVETDSLVVEVDSLAVAEWADAANAGRGLRVRATTEGSRVRVNAAVLRVEVVSQVNPDTLLTLHITGLERTFLYTPSPPLSEEAFQIGGAPSRRATFRFELPERIDGGPAVCARVQCPFEITPERLMYAGLVLTTREPPSPAFQPVDSLTLVVRPVLAPERLPRSPLGNPIEFFGQALGADVIGVGGRLVEIPLTAYIRDVVTGVGAGGSPVPTTVSILAIFEPELFELATFHGPGSAAAPRLRLILTLSEGVRLP